VASASAAHGGGLLQIGASTWSRSAYRSSLIKLTGFDPGKGWDAHHMFPQALGDRFKKLGIDIHDPRNLAWWNKGIHQSRSAEYQRAWENFFASGPRTRDETYSFAKELAQKYSLATNFD